MIARREFKAKAEGIGPNKAWCFIALPFDPKTVFGRVRVPIRGTINGFPFRSTILPLRGKNWIQFNKQLQAGAKAKAGDTVTVVVETDDEPREVKLPAYLSKSLGKQKQAKAAYQKLAYSHKKRFVEWVESAKTMETRQRRIDKMAEMLLHGETID